MVFYRRNFVAGGTYFFTATLADRKCDWLVRHVDSLRVAFRHARRERPFAIEALVVLPDHLHSIWTLPPGDADYSHRWRLIKAQFSKDLLLAGAPIHQSAKG
jgi:putative transposase